MLRTSILALICLASLGAAAASAQTSAGSPISEPQVGQLGKDSVWVPTPDALIVRMLQIADVTRHDYVIDLGSGDGRIPIVAAKRFGARALGVEYDPGLVRYSIRSAQRQGVLGRARFVRQDLFETDLSKATVITLYISPGVMDKLRPKLLALAPGTRVVSHQFTLGDWEPDEMVRVERAPAYLWVVPANAAGRWTLRLGEDSYELELAQQHQMLSGSAARDGKTTPVVAARLRGDAVRLTLIDRHGDSRTLVGRVRDDSMAGESRTQEGARVAWSARRR